MEDSEFMETVCCWLENKLGIFMFLIGLAFMFNALAYPFYLLGLKIKGLRKE